MKKIVYLFILVAYTNINAQTIFKVGGSIANRWNETLNNQTLGSGFRVSAEKFITNKLSTGINISRFSFNPSPSVDITYSAASFHYTYYFNKKALQPYTGIGIGYNLYVDNTTLDLGNNAIVKQKRTKNYGVISPFIGLKYTKKEKKLGVFFQVNTDFVPVANITPIGFLSTTLGLSTQF